MASVCRRLVSELIVTVRPAALLVPAALLSGAAALVRGQGIDAARLTIQVGLAAALVLVVPGTVLMRTSGWDRGLCSWQQLPRAFAFSSLLAIALGALMFSLHCAVAWTVAVSFALLASGLAYVAWRSPTIDHPAMSIGAKALFWGWTVVAIAASMVGAPVDSEEQPELVIIRKIAELQTPAWDNLLHRTGVVQTYLETPHYLLTALVSALSGGELVGVYAKLRYVYVLIAAAALFALARALLRSDLGAFIASAIALIWTVADPDPFTFYKDMGIVYPIARRGAIAEAILLPVAMIFTVEALRARGKTKVIIAALMCLTLAMTHVIESVHLLLFIVSGILAAAVCQRKAEAWSGLKLFAACLAILIVFALAQQWLVPSSAREHLLQDRVSGWTQLVSRVHDPLGALAGVPVQDDNNERQLTNTLPEMPYPLLGLCVGALLLIVQRGRSVAWPWLTLVLAFLVFTMPLATLAFIVVARPEALFMMGLLMLATLLILAAGFTPFLRLFEGVSGRRELWAARLGLLAGCALLGQLLPGALLWLLRGAEQSPWIVLAIAGLLMLAGISLKALPWAAKLSTADSGAPASVPLLALAAPAILLLAVPSALRVKDFRGGLPPRERPSLVAQAKTDWRRPDPLNFAAFYPTLQLLGLPQTTRDNIAQHAAVAPPLIPWNVILWLRRAIPPDNVLLSNPDRIYELPMFLNQYIAHSGGAPLDTPEDARYREWWLPQSGGDPLYGANLDRQTELTFLHEYRVNYIIVGPDEQGTLGNHLAADAQHFVLTSEFQGWSVYRVQ